MHEEIVEQRFDYYQQIIQYRKDTLEINNLLSESNLDKKSLKRLKSLLLLDADDRSNEKISRDEWENILRQRIIIASNRELKLLSQVLCMV